MLDAEWFWVRACLQTGKENGWIPDVLGLEIQAHRLYERVEFE